jgi:hypothetical protein
MMAMMSKKKQKQINEAPNISNAIVSPTRVPYQTKKHLPLINPFPDRIRDK